VARNAVERAQKATVYIIIKIIYDIVRKTNTRRLNTILYVYYNINLNNKQGNLQLEYAYVHINIISYRHGQKENVKINIDE